MNEFQGLCRGEDGGLERLGLGISIPTYGFRVQSTSVINYLP